MSKIDSTSSNNSRTSSETSETQSVEENIQTGSNESRTRTQLTGNVLIDRSARKSKYMKDGNNEKEPEKRPPWRAVSLSTLPKPDKNALLKAKLLDASRRMRAGRSSISIQTDIVPTKLMKEVNLGVQVDLILLREAAVMTDGSYMKKKQGTDEFILTYAVSTVTDAVQFANVSTQTLLPKIPEDKLLINNLESDVNSVDSEEFNEMQRKLLYQINKLRKASNLSGLENEEHENVLLQDDIVSSRSSFLKNPTLQSWHFELDEIGGEITDFQPYIISPNRPWKSFIPLNPGGLYSNCMGPQRLDWSILFLAIDELIQESNCLVDMIEDLSTPKVKIVEIPKLDIRPQQLPSDHWIPIIEQQERKLESLKENVKNSASDCDKSCHFHSTLRKFARNRVMKQLQIGIFMYLYRDMLKFRPLHLVRFVDTLSTYLD